MAPEVKDKVNKLINRISDQLLPQPMGVTPDGRLIRIPHTEILKPGESSLDDHVAMIKYFELAKKQAHPLRKYQQNWELRSKS